MQPQIGKRLSQRTGNLLGGVGTGMKIKDRMHYF